MIIRPVASDSHEHTNPGRGEGASSRRSFVMASMGLLLAGCASATRSARLPDPAWPGDPVLSRGPDATSVVRTGTSQPTSTAPGMDGVLPRSAWASGNPVPTLMDQMLPVRYITVHHDGTEAFYETAQQSVAGRLDAFRNGHRNKGWGDIGYHFAVDRSGRIWQCRPLTWQGAHVRDHNEGNIGVLNIGNFDLQSPSDAQIQGLTSFLRRLQAQYRVSVTRVKTHQEWNPTACPGRTLQRQMVALRSNGALG